MQNSRVVPFLHGHYVYITQQMGGIKDAKHVIIPAISI